MTNWVRGLSAVAMLFCSIGCGAGTGEIDPTTSAQPDATKAMEDGIKESMEKGGMVGKATTSEGQKKEQEEAGK